MKTVVHKANDRGGADHGWLKAKHSFSFGHSYNPEKVHFGALRVLNDDEIAPGAGFPTHPHDNFEIVTIPMSGGVEHRDSMGNHGIINPGEVQIMSAGTGVEHSEYNASKTDWLKLFQIWVFPKERNIQPRYDQKAFPAEGRIGNWQTVVSPTHAGAMWINQDAFFSLGHFAEGATVDYKVNKEGNGVYLLIIEGSAEVGNNFLGRRDAIGVWETGDVKIDIKKEADILAIEIPMEF